MYLRIYLVLGCVACNSISQNTVDSAPDAQSGTISENSFDSVDTKVAVLSDPVAQLNSIQCNPDDCGTPPPSCDGCLYEIPFRPILNFIASFSHVSTVPEPSGLVQQYVYQVGAGSLLQFDVPFKVGEIFTGFRLELYGDGAVDMAFSVDYAASPTSQLRNLQPALTMFDVPAGWNTYAVAPFSRVTTATDKLIVALASTPGSTSGTVYIRQAIATFQHLVPGTSAVSK